MQVSQHAHGYRGCLSPINPFLKMGLSLVLMSLALVLDRLVAMGILVGGLLLLLGQFKLRPLLLGYGLLTLLGFALASAWLLAEPSEAAFSTLRLLAILLPAPILALSTPAADLIRALQTLPLPSFLTLSVMLIWRFFPLIQQELQRIWEANQLRGIDLSRRPGQWFSGLMVPLVFQMVSYADEVTIGLQTRGYAPDAPRSCSKPLGWHWRDTLFCVGALLWLGLIGYGEWGG
ncbi:Putative cobalt transport protein CbiQ [Halomicronema hongdechloris C2206]|uniref:Cobalt transport protein CbiQ n=1 Tax=Halomicronema hongdechloris C2206 TaxID=1641165 RepID=A0A1Z3HT10_9CYAN|nr:energy-coupling factor transporter transmembrane component T [Halomicronema hongdechloris]ASC73461.1 Putative cobalt transport protein CbiQ [Halomicronema hongdechloris C2206]